MTGYSLKEISARLNTGQIPQVTAGKPIYTQEELVGAVGNINSPLLDMPLKNSLAMKAGVGSATFTRASTATYIDRYGVLKTAAIDEPRFEKEGYLNEGASTNLLLNSEDFSTTWATAGITLTANTTDTTDPYGTNIADKLLATITTPVVSQPVAKAASAITYTASVFVKGDSTSFTLSIDDGTTTNRGRVMLDLTTGLISITTVDGNFTSASSKIEQYTNGWYRLSLTVTSNTTTTIRVRPYFTTTGNIVYLFGAQLEALPFATSYIPTTSATVTRAADVLNVTKAGNVPNLEKNGVISAVFDFDFLGVIPSANAWIWGIYQSSTDSIGAYVSASKYLSSIVNSTTDANSVTDTTSYVDRVKYRAVQVVDNSGNNLYVNGAFKVSDTDADDSISSTLNTNVASIRIGSYNPTNTANAALLFGHISNFRIYDTALTSQEVALA